MEEKRIYNYVSKMPFSVFQVGTFKRRLNAGTTFALTKSEHQQLQNPNHVNYNNVTYIGCSEPEDEPAEQVPPSNPEVNSEKESEVEEDSDAEVEENSDAEVEENAGKEDSSKEEGEAQEDTITYLKRRRRKG